MKKILFVTGTDTGAGKTVLTAMLLSFLRAGGRNVLAMKPFCSGSRDDARVLHAPQAKCLTLDEVNPFYFDKPVAPAAADGKGVPGVTLSAVTSKISRLADRCELLLVEGAGGLLAPLGADYTIRDLIQQMNGRTIVVCQNRLGVINHVLLTSESLQNAGIKQFTIVMMGVKKPDISASSNPRMIRQRLPGIPVFCLPHLGNRASKASAVKINAKYLKKVLADIADGANLALFFKQRKRLNNKTC